MGRKNDVNDSLGISSPAYDLNIAVDKIIGEYKRNVHSYTTESFYAKGVIKNNVYRSEFIQLFGRLPEGYSWMNSSEYDTLLQNDAYPLDWEVAVKGNLDEDRFLGLFTVSMDANADFERCIEILKTINKDYMFDSESTGGTTIFTNMGLDDPNLGNRRKYNSASFNNDLGIKRVFAFNKVNDRLVCIVEQYGPVSTDERISVFCEY